MIRRVSAAAVGLLVAGCGGGGDEGRDRLADQPARAILRTAAGALADVSAIHIEGRSTDATGTTTVIGDVTADGDADLRATGAGGTFAIRVKDGRAHLRAGAAFWRAQAAGAPGRTLAARLAGRWVIAPAGTAAPFKRLRPRSIARCAETHLGSLDTREDSLAGKRAVVITDDGGAPGSAPGEIWVAASGAPYPFRILQTAPRSSGGTPVAGCDTTADAATRTSDIRLSRFNTPVRITAPPNPLALP